MQKLTFFLILSITFSSQAEVLEGVAKNHKGEVVYHEKHKIDKDEQGFNKFIQVEYFDSQGAKFATMSSDFSKSRTVPETQFEDLRFKSKFIIRVLEGNVEFEEFKNEKSISKKKIPFFENMVASQGFDNFIRLNLSKLASGPVDFKFGAIPSQDFYSLTGYQKSSTSMGEIEYGIRASHWLLRLFASELRVLYDTKNMQIKLFSGRSNILDAFGNSQNVIIQYQKKEKP